MSIDTDRMHFQRNWMYLLYIERGEQGEFWWTDDADIHKLWTKFIWFDCIPISVWTIDFHIYSRDQVGQGWFVKVWRSTNRDTSVPTPVWTSWNLVKLKPHNFRKNVPFKSTVFTSRNIKKQCRKKYHLITSFPCFLQTKRNNIQTRHKRQDADITVAGGTVVAWNGWRLMSCLCF